jgi:hypothetical protein
MNTLIRLLFFSVPFLAAGPEIYQRQMQICSGMYTVDRKWQLTINDDGLYNLNIYSINTQRGTKQKVEKYSGTWETAGDTLKLKYKILLEHHFAFLKKGNRLIPLSQPIDTVTGYRMQIDYLEKL